MTSRPRLDPDPVKLSEHLVHDCMSSVLDSSGGFGAARSVQAFETKHPVDPGTTERGDLSIPGASCLWVTFDDLCHLAVAPDTHNSRTELAFFADEARTQCIGRFRGKSHSFRPFIVPASRLFFDFTFDARDTPCFGVKFSVTKLAGLWLEETRVLTEPSLEWGCWLLEFLLSFCTGQHATALPQGAVHNHRLCSALVRYLRTPAVPFRHRVVPLLTQLVSRPDLFSMTDPPQLEPILSGVKDACVAVRNAIKSRGQVFLPRLLQQMFELITTASTSHRAMRAAAPARPLSYQECRFRPEQDPGTWVPPLAVELFPHLISDMTETMALEQLRLMLLSMCHGTRLPDHWMCRAIMFSHGYRDTSRVSAAMLAQCHRANALFTAAHDDALISLASAVAKHTQKTVIELEPNALKLGESERASYPGLIDFDTVHAPAVSLPDAGVDFTGETLLRLRFVVLLIMNRLLFGCIQMVDTAPGSNDVSLGYMLRRWSHLVFTDTKVCVAAVCFGTTASTSPCFALVFFSLARLHRTTSSSTPWTGRGRVVRWASPSNWTPAVLCKVWKPVTSTPPALTACLSRCTPCCATHPRGNCVASCPTGSFW